MKELQNLLDQALERLNQGNRAPLTEVEKKHFSDLVVNPPADQLRIVLDQVLEGLRLALLNGDVQTVRLWLNLYRRWQSAAGRYRRR